MCLRLPDNRVEEYRQQAETKKQAKIILAKKYLRKLEKERLMDEVKNRKNTGEDADEKMRVEALLSSEVIKSKYYRKKS